MNHFPPTTKQNISLFWLIVTFHYLFATKTNESDKKPSLVLIGTVSICWELSHVVRADLNWFEKGADLSDVI